MYAVVASASGSSSWNKWKWREPISSTSPSSGTKPSTVSSDSLRNDGREARFEQEGRNREDERYDSRNGSRADGDARARRRILGHRGPADERANERDEHRTDGDAGGAERHERHLHVRDRRPRSRPEAPARESRH